MAKLEDITVGSTVKGIAGNESVSIVAAQWYGSNVLEITYKDTDPPYYSNVPYADFADFFYVWLRKSMGDVYPNLFATMQTPKKEELVADPYRAGGKEKAAEFFENGMLKACKAIYKSASNEYPVTIYLE